VSLTGAIKAELTRVECGAAVSKVRPPYDLIRDVAGFLSGKNLALLDVNAPASGTFDAGLAGLWEGEGEYEGRAVELLWSVDNRGRTVFAMFPFATGTLRAADGRYEMTLGAFGVFSGTYRFQGGNRDGSIQVEDAGATQTWSPYDPNRRPPYETPIVGHCN
jgi:hypothetical protein